jgi:hypothetical protein
VVVVMVVRRVEGHTVGNARAGGGARIQRNTNETHAEISHTRASDSGHTLVVLVCPTAPIFGQERPSWCARRSRTLQFANRVPEFVR